MKNNFLNNKQLDFISTENGGLLQSQEDWERETGFTIINSIKFGFFIGFGYWKDVYRSPFNGYTHNILLPFIRIQNGLLRNQSHIAPQKPVKK